MLDDSLGFPYYRLFNIWRFPSFPYLKIKRNGDSLTWNLKNRGFPYLKIHKFGGFTKFPIHVFDRYEVHIQAFLHFINGKFIIWQSSSPQKYFQNMYSTCHKQKKTNKTRTHMVHRTYMFSNIFDFFESQIDKNNIFPRWFQKFLVFFEAFW